jgi:PST family polysaccharide transporter
MLSKKIKNFFVTRESLKQILLNILWQFFDKVIRLGVGVYISIWLARYFGPTQYGQYSYALAFVGIFSGLATFGLGGIVVRSLVNREHGPGTILGTAYSLHLLGSILCMFLIYICSIYQVTDKLTQELIYILSFGLIFQTSVVIRYWYESILKIRYLVLIENIIFLVFCLIRIVLINKNLSVAYFVLLIVIENLCISVVFGILYFYKNRADKWNIKVSIAKKMLGNSWPIMVSGFAVLLYMKIDQIMLGELAGNRAVGIYSVAIKISELWYTIPVILASSFLPSTILKKNNGVDYLGGLRKLMSVLTTLAIMLSIFIYFFSDQLV